MVYKEGWAVWAAGLQQDDLVLLILFCAMVAAFSLVNPRFFSVRAMANILQDFCPVMLMAIGQTFVIASRGIDLSVGSVLGLAGVTMALVIAAGRVRSGTGDQLGLAAAVAVGAVAGLVSGLLIPPAAGWCPLSPRW